MCSRRTLQPWETSHGRLGRGRPRLVVSSGRLLKTTNRVCYHGRVCLWTTVTHHMALKTLSSALPGLRVGPIAPDEASDCSRVVPRNKTIGTFRWEVTVRGRRAGRDHKRSHERRVCDHNKTGGHS